MTQTRNPRHDHEMAAMCANCPFGPNPIPLRPGRVDGIKDSLRYGAHFPCHKTTESDDEGEPMWTARERGCAGARQWTRKNGCENGLTLMFDERDRREGRPTPEIQEYPYDPE